MNILLLNPDEISPTGVVSLRGHKLDHLNNVLKVSAGKVINVGIKIPFLIRRASNLSPQTLQSYSS